MFKKYKIKIKSQHPEIDHRKNYDVEFFVRSKSTRNGFCHEAVVIGILPTKEGHKAPYDRSERRAKKSYCNRTWEAWDGQSVLKMLWNKILELEWVDTAYLPKKNPFDSDNEPKYESLWDPNELFAES